MAHPTHHNERRAQVERALSEVYDPELDETVTDLRFVSSIDLDDAGVVKIAFRLPTYWCSPNFAFMMASDMRDAVAVLPWVSSVEVMLDEHMFAKPINDAVRCGSTFKAAFGDGAQEGNLEDIRHSFLQKAFRRRQERLLAQLVREHGMSAHAICALSVDGLRAMSGGAGGLIAAYLARRQVAGAFTGRSAAFVDVDGAALEVDDFEPYLASLRRVNINTMHNGVMCRRLLEVRYGLPPAPDAFSDQPAHL